MSRALIVLGLALVSAGCTSLSLHRYVGRDVAEFVQRYGPPTERQTLPNGDQRMQWAFAGRKATAAPLDAFRPLDVAPIRRRIAEQANGPLFGGTCVYALRARRDPPGERWRVVAFETPSLVCT